MVGIISNAPICTSEIISVGDDSPQYYYYIGKKTNNPVVRFYGLRPCWIVRVIQSLIGIHWIKSQN